MPYGLSETEIEWMDEGYRLFREGDPAFMDRFAPDAKIIVPATLPAGGTYDSAWDALEFWTTIAELFENPFPDPEEFLRVEDRVIVLGTWRGRSRETGRQVAVRFVHAFRMDGQGAMLMDQKTLAIEFFGDTAAIRQALEPADPG